MNYFSSARFKWINAELMVHKEQYHCDRSTETLLKWEISPDFRFITFTKSFPQGRLYKLVCFLGCGQRTLFTLRSFSLLLLL
jgi:hypothetical protein